MKTKLYFLLLIAALVCFAGWTGYEQKQNSRKQAWEYKSVYDHDGRFRGDDTFNEMGAEGWELVLAASVGEGTGVTYVFKRAK